MIRRSRKRKPAEHDLVAASASGASAAVESPAAVTGAVVAATATASGSRYEPCDEFDFDAPTSASDDTSVDSAAAPRVRNRPIESPPAEEEEDADASGAQQTTDRSSW